MFSHIKNGMAVVLRNKKMVALFYFSNLLIGFIFILPFRAALSQFLGSSRMAENLHHFIDLTFLAEFFKTNGAVMGQLGLNLFVLAPLYFLLMLFLSGGAFALFVRGGGWPEQFWASAAAFFWRSYACFCGACRSYLSSSSCHGSARSCKSSSTAMTHINGSGTTGPG